MTYRVDISYRAPAVPPGVRAGARARAAHWTLLAAARSEEEAVELAKREFRTLDAGMARQIVRVIVKPM